MIGKELVKLGDLQLDPQRRLFLRDGDAIRLPKLSYELLHCLIRHSPAVVTTEQLLDEVWGNVVVGEETVKQRVSLLRQALDDRGEQPRYIEAIRGVGYRLIPPVEPIPDATLLPRGRGRSGLIIVTLASLTAMAALFFGNAFESKPPARTIAVLPFEDMSSGGDQDYFSDGMHEELIARLAHNPSLAVTSRTSVMPYRDASKPLAVIADELGVELIVEGSVRQADGRVRITVQLIDAVEDRHLWTETYDRPLTVGDLFDIQGDVAGQVAQTLRAEVAGDVRAGPPPLPTDSLVAYDNYLLGRYHLMRGNARDLRKSLAFYEAAVAEDPGFAEAHVGLGRALAFIGTTYGWLQPAEAFERAEEHADIALRLDPRLAHGHSLRGDILAWYHWRWQEAEASYLRAIDMGLDDDLGYLLLLSVLQRHDEAISRMARLVDRYPRDHWVRSNAAWRYDSAGEPDLAIAEATAAIGIDDSYGDPYASRGWAHLAKGRYDEAIADFERNVNLNSHSAAAQAALAIARIKSGDAVEGRALLDEILQAAATGFVPPEEIARVYVALDEPDNAMIWLQRALEVRSRGLIFLNVQSGWDPVRGDPRFQSLLEQLHLDQRPPGR